MHFQSTVQCFTLDINVTTCNSNWYIYMYIFFLIFLTPVVWSSRHCLTCSRRWSERSQFGEYGRDSDRAAKLTATPQSVGYFWLNVFRNASLQRLFPHVFLAWCVFFTTFQNHSPQKHWFLKSGFKYSDYSVLFLLPPKCTSMRDILTVWFSVAEAEVYEVQLASRTISLPVPPWQGSGGAFGCFSQQGPMSLVRAEEG